MTNELIDDSCSFAVWVEDFRVVVKIKACAQINFQADSIVPCKILIDNEKEKFRNEDLSILLKRTNAKGWNRNSTFF